MKTQYISLLGVISGGGMLEQAAEGSILVPFALVQCRTVRIGTYKAKPSDKVGISTQGIEIKLPLPSNGKFPKQCDVIFLNHFPFLPLLS